jgi:hypothetical protein
MRPSKQLGDRRGNVWEPFRVNHGRGCRPDNTHERRQAQWFDQFDFRWSWLTSAEAKGVMG